MSACPRPLCDLIPCQLSPNCASRNHCIERTADGFILVRDAKYPEAKPNVFTPAEFQALT